MAAVLFRCPATGLIVQGWHAGDASAADPGESYVGMHCMACNQMHFLNPATGRVLGGGDDDPSRAPRRSASQALG